MNKIDKLENLSKFLLGGTAEFTIKNLKSNNHYTFIIKNKKDKKKPTEIYYISIVLRSKIYLGHLQIRLTAESFFLLQAKTLEPDNLIYFNIIKSFLTFIYTNKQIPKGIEIYYTGKCSMCNRVLTDPESIEVGIGKYCLEQFESRVK